MTRKKRGGYKDTKDVRSQMFHLSFSPNEYEKLKKYVNNSSHSTTTSFIRDAISDKIMRIDDPKLFYRKAYVTESMKTKKEEIEKLNGTIKDLLTNPNDLLIKKSKIKILGYSMEDFYDKFVITTNGDKPKIIWDGNFIENKIKYKNTIRKLENQKRLIKAFYSSNEWITRSNEISARDKEKCIYCGRKCHSSHHKKSAYYNPDICLDPNNLITVCKRCEDEIHNKSIKKKR